MSPRWCHGDFRPRVTWDPATWWGPVQPSWISRPRTSLRKGTGKIYRPRNVNQFMTVADRGFPRRGGGAPTQRGERQPIIWQTFRWKLHEIKRNLTWERGRGGTWDPSMHVTKNILYKYINPCRPSSIVQIRCGYLKRYAEQQSLLTWCP